MTPRSSIRLRIWWSMRDVAGNGLVQIRRTVSRSTASPSIGSDIAMEQYVAVACFCNDAIHLPSRSTISRRHPQQPDIVGAGPARRTNLHLQRPQVEGGRLLGGRGAIGIEPLVVGAVVLTCANHNILHTKCFHCLDVCGAWRNKIVRRANFAIAVEHKAETASTMGGPVSIDQSIDSGMECSIERNSREGMILAQVAATGGRTTHAQSAAPVSGNSPCTRRSEAILRSWAR